MVHSMSISVFRHSYSNTDMNASSTNEKLDRSNFIEGVGCWRMFIPQLCLTDCSRPNCSGRTFTRSPRLRYKHVTQVSDRDAEHALSTGRRMEFVYLALWHGSEKKKCCMYCTWGLVVYTVIDRRYRCPRSRVKAETQKAVSQHDASGGSRRGTTRKI